LIDRVYAVNILIRQFTNKSHLKHI
jgi:hypothetical protein